jgi:hypothetical protein
MISFTQYLRPDGRRKEGGFDRPEEIEELAKGLQARGVYFDAEVLRTGQVSLTAEREDDDGEVDLLAIEVVANGPGIGQAVDRLIREAVRKLESNG